MPSPNTTRLLRALAGGHVEAEQPLIDLVYHELRGLAQRLLVDNPRATLQATELIHEAWLRLIDPHEAGDERWDGRGHFQRVAARAMRYVLVDRARARFTLKRGGAPAQLPDEELVGEDRDLSETLHVHEGLELLAAVDPDLARVVELRFFGGLTMDEVADAMGISVRSAHRSWRLAKAWWHTQFGDDP